MPVIQIMVDRIEADDIVAVLARANHYKGRSKIVISSDKDFLQLCNQETTLYRPIQDTIVTQNSIVSEYGIHPNNLLLHEPIAGDASDNIKVFLVLVLEQSKNDFPFYV